MRSSSDFSNSMSPVAKTIFALFNEIICRGVGSNVSGLVPCGTRTSTLKSLSVISLTIYFSGSMLTTISALWCSLRPPQAKSRVVASRVDNILYICFLIDKIFLQRYTFRCNIHRGAQKSPTFSGRTLRIIDFELYYKVVRLKLRHKTLMLLPS